MFLPFEPFPIPNPPSFQKASKKMVAAWYFDDAAPGDQRAPHQYSPNKPVTLEQLKELGVEYYHVDVTKEGHMDEIEKMCLERNYQNRDLVGIRLGLDIYSA